MLFRDDSRGLLWITQPAHAWLSGQFARAWGGEAAAAFEPREEVCLAAEQHDAGWAEWEAAPRLNPVSGRPYSFTEMPLADHLAIWRRGPRRVAVQSRYAGLLVSLHGTGLYTRYRKGPQPPEVVEYLERESAWQEEQKQALKADPSLGPFVVDDVVEMNRRLVAIWDWLSLLICRGLRRHERIQGIPGPDGEMVMALIPLDAEGFVLSARPWPFRENLFLLACEGYRIAGVFSDEEIMRAALRDATPTSVVFELRREL